MCCEPTRKGKENSELDIDCGCGCIPRNRYFVSKEEKIEMMEKYKKELENEIRGVEEKIDETKK